MKRKALLATLWIGGGVLALFFLVRTFVADVYRVESGSMEPFIHGGEPWAEWVLVRYDGDEGLQRFDLAVVYKGGEKPIVKRVVGLPGENVQVLGGDLFIDGSRLDAKQPRPRPVVLFDSATQRVTEEFELDAERWTEEGGAWTLDSRGRREPGPENTLRWLTGFDDGYLLPDGSRVRGGRDVNDGGVELELELLERGGTLRIDLREEGDCFRATLELATEPASDGRLRALARIQRLLLRAQGSDLATSVRLVEPETLVEKQLWVEPEGRRRVHFSNIDNTLLLAVDDSSPLQHAYAENRVPDAPPVAPGRTLGAQVALGGEGLHARFHAIRVARDLYWISRGTYAIERPISLGPREYFLLGDNSAQSLDGRTWGATRGSEILGRPRSVIWPRSRARSLSSDGWRRLPEGDSGE